MKGLLNSKIGRQIKSHLFNLIFNYIVSGPLRKQTLESPNNNVVEPASYSSIFFWSMKTSLYLMLSRAKLPRYALWDESYIWLYKFAFCSCYIP